LNVPLRALTPAADHRRAFDSALEEIAGKFRPDLVIISAGFDAHMSDPLGQLRLKDEDFVAMTRSVNEWARAACDGRVVSCLEGGYNLSTLGASVSAHVRALSEAEVREEVMKDEG
jgi:acetoin utilization deacetylase AcuC-like enzyme